MKHKAVPKMEEGNPMSTIAAVYGIFVTPSSLEAATDGLISAGLSCQEMSILMSDKAGWHDFSPCKGERASETTATEVGGVVGGLVGLLVGLGAVAIPGAAPLVAAGPLMASLAGLGVGGALGGLVGGLVDLGLPEYEAKLYEGRLKDGAVLLSVHCASIEQIDIAKDVLQANGAEDIASAGEDEAETPQVEARAMS
jgi:hypothetical protein